MMKRFILEASSMQGFSALYPAHLLSRKKSLSTALTHTIQNNALTLRLPKNPFKTWTLSYQDFSDCPQRSRNVGFNPAICQLHDFG